MQHRNTLATAAIVAFLLGRTTGAGDFVVAPADTAGLIAAIQAANANPGPDTIRLAAGSTYTFAAGAFSGSALPVTEGVLTIEGNGATIERVGASSFRMITNNGNLTLNNLTVTGGSASTGAGIINNNLLTLNNCTLSENRGGGNGGAIFNPTGSRVEATGTLFHRNAANGHSGGVVSSSGEVVFTDCTFTENEASSAGAIGSSGSVVIDACTFTGNFSTSGLGGAINNFNNGTLEVTGSTFTGNQAGTSGGAISQRGTSATIADCTFAGNTALTRDGGAINAEVGDVAIEHCVFIDNVAEDHGGAINAAVPVAMTDCFVRDNQAGLDGGGMRGYNAGGFDLDRVTVADNTAGREGGGIYAFSAATTILNSTISANFAGTEGGGLRMWSGANAAITNATLHANTAGSPGGGGGVRIQFSGPAVSNTIVSGSTGGDIVGPIADLGHNLVQDGSGLTDPTSKSGNPMLAPLADNGGLTPTHHLIFGSPAIHAGDCAGGTLDTDQRGVARPQSFGCDIGAYEAPPCPPDLNGDVQLNFFDVQQFIAWFVDGDPRADFTGNGTLDFFDVQAYLAALAAGCD